MSESESSNIDRLVGKGENRDDDGDDPGDGFEDTVNSDAAADAQQVVNQIANFEISSDESQPQSSELSTKSERAGIATPEQAVRYLDSFDEQDFEYDHWNGASFETIKEGTLVEIWTGDMGFEQEKAIVVDQTGADEYTVITENGVEKTLSPNIDSLDFDHTQEAALSNVWHDNENRAESVADTDTDTGEDTATTTQSQSSTADSTWADTTDFEQYHVNTADGLTPGQSVEVGDSIEQIETHSAENGIDYYTTTQGKTLGDIDGVITQVNETSRVDVGRVQYVQWADGADMEDGWYSVGDSIQEQDGNLIVEYVDENGTVHDVDGEAVELDGLIERKHTPTHISAISPSLSDAHTNYSGEYPTTPSLDSNVSVSGISQNLTPTQQTSIERGLGKAQKLGLTDGVTGIEELDVGGEAAGETLARFEPETGKIKINTDRLNQETLDSLSESFGVGETVEDMVVHETIHAAHAQSLKESDWTPQEMREKLLRSELPESEAKIMENEVSSYAASNPLEAVAEVGTKITLGKEVSENALHIYEKYGGPEL